MKRRLTLAVVLGITVLSGNSIAAEKRAMTVEDLWAVKRVGAPQVSADGRWLAYEVTSYSLQENEGRTDVWIVPSKGGEAVQLTTNPAYDGHPRWNPAKPAELAFISERSGSAQIHFISLDGGEARQISHVPTGVKSFVWSPDGSLLAFATRVYPDAADPEETAKRDREKAESKVQARIFTSLLFRHWNQWWDEKRSHVFVMPSDGSRYWDVTPGDYDTPPLALAGPLDFQFSPDGVELVFVRNTDPVIATSTNNDIFVVPAEGGEPQRLTTSRGNDNGPKFSPDGRFLAYRSMPRPGFEADQVELILLDRRTGLRSNLTGAFDRDVGEYVWAPDGKTIYFTAADQGRTRIYALDLRDGTIRTVVSEHTNGGLAISPDGQWLYFRQQAISRPNELCRVRADGTGFQVLTSTNAELLAQLELPEPEDFWFHSFDRTRVHSLVLRPPFFATGQKYPLVFLIHGGPQGMWADQFHFRWNAELFASPGYVVAMLNFRGSKGYGQSFCDAVSKNWGGGPYQDLMLGLDSLLIKYSFVDADRVAAAGASYGGFMINWIAGHTDRFKVLVSHDGVFDQRMMYYSTEELWFPEWEFAGVPYEHLQLYEKWSPSNFVGNFVTPTLVIHGENDFRLPLTQGIAMFTALQRKGVPSKFLYFPDEDHFVQKPQNSKLWWDTVLGWIAEWINH